MSVMAAATLLPTSSWAEPILVFNTGVNDFGVPLPGGAVDPHWQLTVSADIHYPGPDLFVLLNSAPVLIGGGTPNTSISKWIGPRADGGHLFPRSDCQAGCTEANYHYQATFDLTGLNPAMSVLSGQWSPDDSCVMFLNGTQVASYPFIQGVSWRVFQPFTVTTGFVPGLNTLTVVVNNHFYPNSNLRPNPSGLHMQIAGTSPVCPVPFADADTDGDVDHDDFAIFQQCYTGGNGGVPESCSCFDRVEGTSLGIDGEDFVAFKNCRTGPNVPFDSQNPPVDCVP